MAWAFDLFVGLSGKNIQAAPSLCQYPFKTVISSDEQEEQKAAYAAANFCRLWAILTSPHSVFTFARPRKWNLPEAHVLFDVPEDGFHFHGARRP